MLRLSSRLLSSRGFASIPSVTDVHLVGCGIDYGAGRRGVDMGPSMVRFADIGPKLAEMGYSVHDRGNVSVPDKDTVEVPAQGEKARYHEIIGPVLADLATHTDEAVTQGAFPITIGGVSCFPPYFPPPLKLTFSKPFPMHARLQLLNPPSPLLPSAGPLHRRRLHVRRAARPQARRAG